MPERWSITVHGDEEEERRIARLALFLADLRPFWPVVSRLFRQWMRLQFDSEGSFWTSGGKWTPLSPAYAARKRILWGERPILQASGQAYRAALNPTRTVTPRSLTLVIDDSGSKHGPVLEYHQEGDGVPRREIVGDNLPPLAAMELERAADQYVRDLLARF